MKNLDFSFRKLLFKLYSFIISHSHEYKPVMNLLFLLKSFIGFAYFSNDFHHSKFVLHIFAYKTRWRRQLRKGLSYHATAVLFSTAIAKERTKLRVSDFMSSMADLCTNCTTADTITHFASVTMIPMLITKVFLSECESALQVRHILSFL